MSHEHTDLGHGAPVRIAAISLAVTAALLVLKLVLGLISGSIAVLSDAVDSGTDLTAGAAALISVRLSAQPADEAHPYGHGKIETISASVAATIVGIGGGVVVFQAVRRLVGESPDINVEVGLAAVLVSAVANVVLAFFMRREAKRSQSMALRAESTHLQTNVVQAGTIIVGLTLVGITGAKVFDPLVALGLAAYMGWTAVGRGFHRLRTRRAGAIRHVDMHVLVDPHLTITDVHPISDGIEREIEGRLPGTICVIHVEPDDGRHTEEFEALVRERTEAKAARGMTSRPSQRSR